MDDIITVWEVNSGIFSRVGVIDDFYSLVWTERYNSLGDYELELPISYSEGDLVVPGRFLTIPSSDRIMRIEDLNPQQPEESIFLVKGYSGESILRWRVMVDELTLVGADLSLVINALMEDNFTAPYVVNRTIEGLTCDLSSPALTGLILMDAYEIQRVGEVIEDLCSVNQLGYSITFDGVGLTFRVFSGVDHSFDGPGETVIFSTDFDNVLSSNYYMSNRDSANTTVIVTEVTAPGYDMVYVYLGDEPSGYGRQEVLVSATDITDEYTIEEIGNMIFSRAVSGLYEYRAKGIFDGEVDIYGTFKYGIDFFVGDIVQCIFSGKSVRGRVVEVVKSINNEGETTYISFDFDIE